MDAQERSRLISKVAAYIYAMTVLNQADNNYFIALYEIEEYFGKDFFPENWNKDIELLKDIQTEIIEKYPGCGCDADTCWLNVNGYDEYGDPIDVDPEDYDDIDGFNLVLFTNYIACDYDADENEE